MCDIPFDAATCDEFISAEIPDLPPLNDTSKLAEEQRRYHNLVTKYMIHTCINTSGCWNGRKCTKGFPKNYIQHTIVHDDRPAEYRRRSPVDGGNTYTIQKTGITYDNRHVVPHNRYLLLRWGGHINLEWVIILLRNNFFTKYFQAYGLHSAKYVFKYILKGESAAYIRTEPESTDSVELEKSGQAEANTVLHTPSTSKKIVHYDQLVQYFKVNKIKFANLI